MKISNTDSNEKKVTVFGLGLMGSGIARAFIANGYSVTVWNRDVTKAASLLSRGAVLAKDPNEAIVASPLLVICVSDYKVTHKIFSSADVTLLKDRTIIQLSSGTPKEARSFDGWIQKLGGSALNGDILAWPAQIGSSEATITISGANQYLKSRQQR
ncbi:NAD(P)-binding domain-containing protein [Sphingobacterium sp. E70]|uniref:NAD(P)-binding domain-containing protein n=1 Tax=Sphingobacterium sp. E70 TaxID=2853439 RepID=UPI00211B7B82|nr:NAD(P)-binding domain-containing protein [Sphingobacterium sp. E70]ULT26000.1 NAD(P)-binding domain-containing protein [Sphingobacterium sp. E70]